MSIPLKGSPPIAVGGVSKTTPATTPAAAPVASQTKNEPQPQVQLLRFRISAKNIVDKDSIGSTDPYVKLFAWRCNGWELLATSEILKNNLYPQFFMVFQDHLETDAKLRANQFWKIEFFDHDEVGSDDFVGNTIVQVETYCKNGETATVPLSTSGTVTVKKAN